jgi:hypothetical protein
MPAVPTPSVRGAASVGFAWGLLALVLAGCFKPDIQEGGFVCSTTGKACPDGFQCAADNRCRRSLTPAGDAGEPMCSSPPVAPTCQEGPRTGELCNPACQKGCECGRCNVVSSGHAACVPSGTAKLGEVCKLGNADNCGSGLICLQEACGDSLGRCYRHCTSNDQCGGTICQIPIEDARGQDTGFKTCDVPPQVCDPVANTGCPDAALNCYLTSANLTLCDCPGGAPGGKNGDPCTIYNDCAAGFVCVSGVGGVAEPRCRQACSVASPACTGGATCIPTGTGAKYGYCG